MFLATNPFLVWFTHIFIMFVPIAYATIEYVHEKSKIIKDAKSINRELYYNYLGEWEIRSWYDKFSI